MSVLASDSFTGSDANPIGGNWTTVTSEGALKRVSNTCAPASLSSDSGARNTAATWPNDQYSQCKVTVSGTDAQSGIGPACRIASAAETLYRVVINSAGSNNVTLAKIVATAYTQIWTRTASFTNGDLVRLEAQGTTLRVFIAGTQVGTDTTDSSISSGAAGIGYSSASSSASVDDWEGGDFSGGGTDATVTPGAVSGTAAVPAPTLSTGETVTATAVAGVGAVPAVTVTAVTNVSPAAVVATASVPAPTLSTGETVTAVAVAGVAAVPAPALSTGETVTASTVAAVAAIPAPSVSAGGTATVGATTVNAVASVPAATLSTGEKVTASAVAAPGASIPAVTVGAGAGVSPVTVAAVTGIHAVVVSTGTAVAALVVRAVAAIPAVVIGIPTGLPGEAHGPIDFPTGAVTYSGTALTGQASGRG